MKVILVNGSPREKGCTYTALCEVAGALEKNGIETEIFQVGAKPIAGCIGCNVCLKNGRCFVDDPVNEFVEKAKTADGFVFGSPVHYAAASGAITSFLDRAFYGKGNVFAGKPGAAVVSCRRGGAASAFDQLNKYFTINSMPVVSSQYWNQVHGNTPDEVRQDAGQQYGMAAQMYSGRGGSGNHIPGAGTCNENKFYSVKVQWKLREIKTNLKHRNSHLM